MDLQRYDVIGLLYPHPLLNSFQSDSLALLDLILYPIISMYDTLFALMNSVPYIYIYSIYIVYIYGIKVVTLLSSGEHQYSQLPYLAPNFF